LKLKHIVFTLFALLLFTACGYKPAATYASKSLEGKVYVTVDIDITNARNSVLIKDALIDLLIGKFELNITNNKSMANSFISGKLISVSQKQLQSDTTGFAKVYRQTVSVEVKYYKKDEKVNTFTMENYYDFTVDDDSTITQSKEDEAVSIAISKALSDLFSKIAVNSQ